MRQLQTTRGNTRVNLEKAITHFSATKRSVGRDVATRYILRFGGSTRAIQTDVDDMQVYLRNHFGLVIATVSMLNTFPEKIDESIFDDMPY